MPDIEYVPSKQLQIGLTLPNKINVEPLPKDKSTLERLYDRLIGMFSNNKKESPQQYTKEQRFNDILKAYGDDITKIPESLKEEALSLQTDIRNGKGSDIYEEPLDWRKYIVGKMGENIKQNKNDIIGNKIINDVMSLGEMQNNINEPEFVGTGLQEPALMIGQKLLSNPMTNKIETSKNAAIKQLISSGRQDLIPSVIKTANNQTMEAITNVENQNAQILNNTEQLNTQIKNQGIQLGLSNEQFNSQMREQKENIRGQAISQNLTNVRDSSRDVVNSLTMNRDNEVSYDMYLAALDDPEMLKLMENNYKMKMKTRKKQETK